MAEYFQFDKDKLMAEIAKKGYKYEKSYVDMPHYPVGDDLCPIILHKVSDIADMPVGYVYVRENNKNEYNFNPNNPSTRCKVCFRMDDDQGKYINHCLSLTFAQWADLAQAIRKTNPIFVGIDPVQKIFCREGGVLKTVQSVYVKKNGAVKKI